MSVVINPVSAAKKPTRVQAPVVPPAEVWDLESPARRPACARAVRTIDVGDRTSERSVKRSRRNADAAGSSFEMRRENRESVLLGAVLTAALIIGSAVGGAFSSGDEVPMSKVAYSASVGAEH